MRSRSKLQSRRRNPKQEGFILITSYALITMLSIFSLGLFMRVQVFYQAAEANQNKIVAFNMAESAVDWTIASLQGDLSYAGTGGYVSASTASVFGGYEVRVCPPTCLPGEVQPVNFNVRRVTAMGHAPNNAAGTRAYSASSIVAHVILEPDSLFNFAVFAEDSLQLNGNPEVDSYNSNDGPYNAATAGENGDIATNSIVAGTVSLSGNAKVKGDVGVGTGSDPANVISINGNATISGGQEPLPEPLNFPAPTVPGSAIDLGTVKISGNNNYQLAAGTYRLSSLQVTGNGTLTPLGPVTIFVDGAVTIAGNGVATQNNLPPNFLMHVTGNDTVKVSGNGDFYGGIYAPNSHVQNTGNGDIFGAVIADTYQQSGNGDVHFDEALKEVEGSGDVEVGVLSWVEENTLLA